MIDIETLPIVIEFEPTDLGEVYWVARHPDLPGCLADGETPEEAVKNLRVSRMLYAAHLEMFNMSLQDVLCRESIGNFCDD